jgi:hypothetical protein
MSAARRARGGVVGALVAMMLAASVAAQPAPFSVDTQAVTLAGAPVTVDVYRPLDTLPDAAEAADAPMMPLPVAIVAHGFSRDRTRGRDLGRDLAAAGIVAIVPDLPNLVDYWGNAAAIRDAVAQLERGAFGLPPTPRGQVVLIGTSAGGVATLIAASKLPGIAGWIGLDPVDRSGTAALAAAKVSVPAIVLLGDPSVCNLFGSGRSIAQSVPTLLRAQRLHGASHCDFEGPTNSFCRNVCGKGARGMDETVRRLTVDAALTMLHERNAPAESASTQPLRDDAETPPAATPDPPVAPAPPDDRP